MVQKDNINTTYVYWCMAFVITRVLGASQHLEKACLLVEFKNLN